MDSGMIKLSFVFGALVLFSCNRGVVVEENSIELIFSEQILEAAKVEYFRGNERKSEVAETALDKTEQNRAARATGLLKSIHEVDSALAVVLIELNNLKLSMFKNKTIIKNFKKQMNDQDPLRPVQIEMVGKRIYFPVNMNEEVLQLKKIIRNYRKIACENIAEQKSEGLPRYFFKDPNILHFESRIDLIQQIDKAINTSYVNVEDKESVKMIYARLTELIAMNPSSYEVPMDCYNFLTCLERGVFAARSDCFSLLALRVASCGYSFNKIMTVINSPSVCVAGDTVNISGVIVAYDSDKVITGTINRKPFETSEGGMVKHKIIIPKNKKSLRLTGTLTIRNKSGVPKTENWERNIQIIPAK